MQGMCYCCSVTVGWSWYIHGYHVYGEVWTMVLSEQSLCEREVGNVQGIIVDP